MTEETNQSNYQKGFNEGYLITKHLPELSDQLSTVKNESPRIEGFKDGREEYYQEKAKMKLSFLNKDVSVTTPAPAKEKDNRDKEK